MQLSPFADTLVQPNNTQSSCLHIDTVEPVLKDYPIGHKNILSRQVVFGDRFIFTGM